MSILDEIRRDPVPVYARLRAAGRTVWLDVLDSLLVLHHADVTSTLREPRLTAERDEFFSGQLPDDVRRETLPLFEAMSRWMHYKDPPDHTRMRNLLNKAFQPKMVAALQDRARALVDELMAPIIARGRGDLVAELAEPLPSLLACELVGVPREGWSVLKKGAEDVLGFLGSAGSAEAALRAHRSWTKMVEFVRPVIEDRRKQPREDLISALIAAEDAGQVLSEDELYAICTFLFVGADDTTKHFISASTYALLHHPDQLARLRDQPDLMTNAIDELLRYTSPVQATSRLALEDFELCDHPLRARQRVLIIFASANRDSTVFERPDELDLSRANAKLHRSLGVGAHYCIGAAFARMEGQAALEAIIRRPRLAVTGPVEWVPNLSLRGPKTMQVEL